MLIRLVLLVLLPAVLGCARIYRPVTVAQPSVPRAEGLTGVLAPQPWGDNSRYERRAAVAGLQVVVLALENPGSADLEILDLEPAGGTQRLDPGAAVDLVRQRPWLYLVYPLLPGLMSLGADVHGHGIGPSPREAYQGLALLGACIAIPNAIVAARSNHRLEAFFREAAWAPGPLRAGERRQGLVFLRTREPLAPIQLQVRYRAPSGEQRLPLACPGIPPPPKR